METRKDVRSLPPELLAHVFNFLVPASPGDRHLVNATHICRFFRTIALECARLWTGIYVSNIGQTEAFLERSKRLPVDVIIHSTPRWAPLSDVRIAVRLSREFDRLRSLEIRADSSAFDFEDDYYYDLEAFLESLAGVPAPQLQKLHVLDKPSASVYGQRPPVQQRAIRNVFHVVDGNHYRSATPSLRSLRLAPVLVSWDSDMFKNLSYLSLGGVNCTPFPTLGQVLTILRHCPTLKTLDLGLDPVHTADNTPRWEPEPVIPLPMLSSLKLCMRRPSNICHLLSYLALPTTTTFGIETTITDGTSQIALLPEHREHLGALKEIPRVEFTADFSKSTAHFQLFSSVTGGRANRFATIVVDTPDLEFIGNAGVPCTLVSTAEVFVYKGNLADEFDHVGNWSATFRAARRLRTLHLIKPGGDLAGILGYLSQPLYDGGSTRCCPQLEVLEVERVIMSNSARAALIWLLTDRKDAGLPLKKLVIRKAQGLLPDFVQMLRDFGVEVEVRPY